MESEFTFAAAEATTGRCVRVAILTVLCAAAIGVFDSLPDPIHARHHEREIPTLPDPVFKEK